jgi:O-antigen/teichoic acid export membrane protein
MAGSAFKRLAVQTSHYSLSSLLAMVAGLVTFPLLTRLFSVADYGVMSLIGATVAVSVAVGKVGVQHSIVRYHSEIAAGQGRYSLAQLSSTTLLAMLVTGGAVALVLAIGSNVVPARWLGDPRVPGLMVIVSLVVAVQVLESALINFMRAEQRTSQLMIYQVLKKYLGLGLILFAVLAIARSLTAFYTATAITEGLAIGALALVMFRRSSPPRPTPTQFSRPLYVELLKFGVPMLIGYELSGIVLSMGARYVIEGTIGETELGLYAAAYNLCQYVQAVVISSVSQAIMPLYMQMWDQKGRAETVDFISRSLRTYALLGAPVIAGLATVGPELLPALASDKYAGATALLPWVIAGMVVDGTGSMLGAGLFIHRKTRIIMGIVVSCALFNLALNIVLVPRLGILGAAIATLVSYAANALALAVAARHLLRVQIPWGTMLRAGGAAVLMWLALRNLYSGHRFTTIGLRIGMGAAIYGLAIMLIDRDARGIARRVASRFNSQSRAS